MAAVYACLNKGHWPIVEVGDLWPEDVQIKGYVRESVKEMQVVAKLEGPVTGESILLCKGKDGKVKEVAATHVLSFSCDLCNNV